MTYKSGAIEHSWENVVQHHACQLAQRDAFSERVHTWLAFAAKTQKELGASFESPAVDPRVSGNLSSFTWPAGGDSQEAACSEVIEPLTGMARHPLASGNGCWLRHLPQAEREVAKMKQVSKYDLGHIIFASRCAATRLGCTALAGRRFAAHRRLQRIHPPARNLLFDLGCADYGRELSKPKTMGGGIQPSLPLLQAIYRQGCIAFDAIWAWEARPKDPLRWWRNVPNATRRILNFTNQPVSLDAFFETLKRQARPDDFVVVKLDIDTPALEMAMVRAIAEREDIYTLIDELLFEYHVSLRMLSNNTAAANVRAATGMSDSTVSEAVQMMQQLRQRGIRTHFWV